LTFGFTFFILVKGSFWPEPLLKGAGHRKGRRWHMPLGSSDVWTETEGKTFWKVQKVFLCLKGGEYVKKTDGS